MDWQQVFGQIRSNRPSKNTFTDAIFDGDDLLLKTPLRPQDKARKPASGEKKQILEAIEKYAQKKKSPATGSLEAPVDPSLGHELTGDFSQWGDYLKREEAGVFYQYNQQKQCSLARVNEAKEVKVVFVGDTYLDGESTHEDLLSKMIGAMNLKGQDYLRLFYSEDFADDEYLYSLLNEIYLIAPQYVVTMGAKTTSLLLKKKDRLSKIHGKFFPIKIVNKKSNNEIFCDVIPIFHPDFLRIKTSMKRTTWIDLQKIMEKLAK